MKRFICVVLALAAASLRRRAQDFRGGITGRILDSQNARMPGVTVTATNVATNVARPPRPMAKGTIRSCSSTPAPTRVTAELSGFKKVVARRHRGPHRRARRAST